MVQWILGLVMVLSVFWGMPVSAQQSLTALTCEQQVDAQYRALASDKLLGEQPGLSWEQQLGSLVSTLRTGKTLFDIEENQGKLAKQNIAQLVEQLRLLSGQNAQLRSEVEKLKHESPSPPASN